jgi:hypothetical protein
VSESVKIKSFQPGNDWTSDDGKIKLTFYECVFDRNGQDFTATWNKKQGTGDPPVGESIEGEFYEKKPGDWRFRKASRPQGGGASSGTSSTTSFSGKRDWQPESQRDPERSARILRQHSQEMAVRVLTAMGSFESNSPTQIETWIRNWADYFDQDVNEAGLKAVQGAGSRALGGVQAESGPAPAQPSADPQGTSERLYSLLEAAGLNSVAARVVTDYALSEMTPQEQDAAIDRLGKPDHQAGALKRLRERTEQFHGEPLPEEVPYDDDENPF